MMVFIISLIVTIIAVVTAIVALYGHSQSLANAALNVFNHQAQRVYKEQSYLFSGVVVIAVIVAVASLVVMLFTAPL